MFGKYLFNKAGAKRALSLTFSGLTRIVKPMLCCRFCASRPLASIIPLGDLPLANALLSKPTQTIEPRYNLEVMLCPACGLAQLKDLIDPVALFSDYVYFSSNADAMLVSAATLAEKMIPTLPKDAFIIEIASNDGYLLKNYVKAGFNVLGIDPAKNIAEVANQQGVPTQCAFFSEELAQELNKADVIHANNVMAHVPDINNFIKGLKILLKPQGQAIIEVPYFGDLVENLEFDTIYHEHVYYFSIKPLQMAFDRHELVLSHIEKLAIHGGTLRLFVRHRDTALPSPLVAEMMRQEEGKGLHTPQTFQRFRERLQELKENLQETLNPLKESGARIAAYGASAKGTTLLNYFGIGKNFLDFIVDKSPAKQGKFAPGTQLEIFSPEKLLTENISHALLLAWNFREEIMQQQSAFLQKGGKFILPLPQVRIIP